MSIPKPQPDHRKDYEVIKEGHVHNGRNAAVGATIRLGAGQARLLLDKKVVKEVK